MVSAAIVSGAGHAVRRLVRHCANGHDPRSPVAAAFVVASVRFGRDSSSRFDITVVDILIAAAIYSLLFSIPSDVTN